MSLAQRACRVAYLILALVAAAACSPDPADLMFRNGVVYKVDGDRSWAQAVGVKAGRIVYVGDNAAAVNFIGDDTEVIDLDGRMLMPGFHDSHMHPMAAGTRFLRCQLQDLMWPVEVLARITECAENVDEGDWLRGVNLADELFEDGSLHRSMLDKIVPEHVVLIANLSGSAIWTNSRGLELTNFSAATADPPKGTIVREPGSSKPTGVLSGTAGTDLYILAPQYSATRLRESLRAASEMANRYGITSANEASMGAEHWEAFVQADVAGEMTLRVQGSQRWDHERGIEQIEEIIWRRDHSSNRRFRANSVKFFLDGGLNNASAAFLDPYVGTLDDRGTTNYETAALKVIAERLDAEGMQLHFHAVGDSAVRQALDVIEATVDASGPQDRRHQVAHIVSVSPEDLPRFAELGVTANYQALWAYWSDERRVEEAVLGPERSGRLMAINSMLASGARVVLGSDWISESMNPLYSIQIAVTRRPPDGDAPVWLPDERAALAQILEAYTINGAWLAGQEHDTGSIEIGKVADLIVLERNLFDVDPMELADVSVLLTMLEGDVVYHTDQFAR